MSKVTLPPPREPAIDARTNTFSRNWILFFQQLFERVGGVVSDVLTLANFTGAKQSLNPTGYQVFPGGYVRQWGIAATDGAGQVIITFPLPKVRCVSVKCEETGVTAASGITFAHSTPTASGFTVYSSGVGTTNAAKTFHWSADTYLD